MFVCCECCVVR